MNSDSKSIGQLIISDSLRGGDVRFLSAQSEVLRLNSDGACFVRGEKVDDNRAIWEAFVGWMEEAINPSAREKFPPMLGGWK